MQVPASCLFPVLHWVDVVVDITAWVLWNMATAAAPSFTHSSTCWCCLSLLQAAKAAGGPTRVEKAKIGLIQFHLSPPKADLENNVIISDYAQVGNGLQSAGC